MNIGSGNRDAWEFEYTASKLAEGAKTQHAHRLSRVDWWAEKKAKIMDEIKESGIEVNESLASQYSVTSALNAPTIKVSTHLQNQLIECHTKIREHQQAAEGYAGWIQVLSANGERRMKLTQADWLYFFGRT